MTKDKDDQLSDTQNWFDAGDDVLEPEEVGRILCDSILRVFQGVPDCSMSPTDLARRIGGSRVVISRMMNAIKKNHPIEALVGIPGPESLRSVIHGAGRAGVGQDETHAAYSSIHVFERLIKEQYGTRAALNAALSVNELDTREKFEQSSRYQVYKGMSQILGVECKLWLSCRVWAPCTEVQGALMAYSVGGPIGLRRLRPDMPVVIEYGKRMIYRSRKKRVEFLGSLNFDQFYANPGGKLEEVVSGGQVMMTYSPPVQSKGECSDMLWGQCTRVHNYRAVIPEQQTRGGSVIPVVPVAKLVSDIIIHRDVFSGIKPEPLVYRTLGKGTAKPEDKARMNDRLRFDGQIVQLDQDSQELMLQEMPTYKNMVEHICDQAGYRLNDFCIYRLEELYPIYGFQYLSVFQLANEDL